jgi:TonB family protein
MPKASIRVLTAVVAAVIGVAPLVAAAQDPPPPPPKAPVRVGGDIKEPKLLTRVEPVYPAEAKANGIQGVVILEVTIAKDGSIASAKVLRGVAPLDAAAIDAVSRWKYTVTYLNNDPVEVLLVVTVNFTLK